MPTWHIVPGLYLEIIQTRMIQKPLLWVEAGKSACVLVGICELRLSPPAAATQTHTQLSASSRQQQQTGGRSTQRRMCPIAAGGLAV